MKTTLLTIITLLAGLLVACDRAPETQSQQAGKDAGGDSGPVLASIDGYAIHQSQLDTMLRDMFGAYQAARVDDTGRRKALDSMLAAHALSQKALAELAPNKVMAINEKTRRYRENLLINTYMQTKLDKHELSDESIRQYYQDNLDKFGRQTVKQYRLLTTKSALPEEDRDRFLATVAGNKAGVDMQALGRKLEKQGFDIELQTGALDKTTIESTAMSQRLHAFIDAQRKDEISDINFIDNKPYLVLITGETTRKPRPLTEVRDDIRKTLLFRQLKQLIRQQSETAMAQSKIEYNDR